MGMDKREVGEVKAKATSEGYSQSSSNPNRWENKDNGKSIVFSKTEQSVKINGSYYNDSANAKKSRSW